MFVYLEYKKPKMNKYKVTKYDNEAESTDL